MIRTDCIFVILIMIMLAAVAAVFNKKKGYLCQARGKFLTIFRKVGMQARQTPARSADEHLSRIILLANKPYIAVYTQTK